MLKSKNSSKCSQILFGLIILLAICSTGIFLMQSVQREVYSEYIDFSFQLTLNPDGGSGGTTSLTAFVVSHPNRPTDYVYITFSAKTITVPTRTGGYTFLGYEIEGYGSLIDASGNVEEEILMDVYKLSNFMNHSTLYAQWRGSHIFTINPNGGSYNGSTGKQTSYCADNTTFTLSLPTRNRYDFAGWVLESGSATITGTGAGTKVTISNQNAEIKANWTEKNWIQTTSEPPKAADGFYEISTAQQFAYFSNLSKSQIVTSSMRLVNNINLDEKFWTPIGTESYPFSGVFDGNYHLIQNLTISMPSNSFVGIFGYIRDGIIQNFEIASGTVSANLNSGCMVGAGYNVTILNCINRASMTGTQDIGGIIGRCQGGTLKNVFNYGAVNGSSGSTGGVIGWCRENTTYSRLETVGNYGSVRTTSNGNVGGIVAGGYRFSGEQLFSYGALSGSGTVGGIVGDGRGSITLEKLYLNLSLTGGNTGSIFGLASNSYGINSISAATIESTFINSGVNHGALVGNATGTNDFKNVYCKSAISQDKLVGTGGISIQNCVYNLKVNAQNIKKFYANAADTYVGWSMFADTIYPPQLFWIGNIIPDEDKPFTTRLLEAGFSKLS